MTSVLLLLVLAQAEGPDAPAQAAPAASAVRWHWLVRGEASTLALLPRGDTERRKGFLRVEPTLGWETLRPRGFASLSLGVDNAR